MELARIETYGEFKEALGTELKNQAEGFVRTGYLLKVARDTDILRESGYQTVAEFALAEYGLKKDIVSRYIAINDRYSENGYSEYLQEKYSGYGVAKLQEMLTLPDAVAELIPPELTRREIQDIKKEVSKEEEISDIEVILEGTIPAQESMTLLQKTLHQYFYDNRNEFVALAEVIKENFTGADAVEKILDVIAPTGISVKNVRIQGLGKVMIAIQGKDKEIELLNIRNGEKESHTWQQVIENLVITFAGNAGKKEWELIYNEPFEEEKVEVVPVQPKIEENTENTREEPKEEFNPNPVQMSSICYSCTKWQQCDLKSTITTECNEYVDKNEVYKTEEQKYSEEQDKIDKKIAKILEERADEEKMATLPSDIKEYEIHDIKIANEFYDDVASGKKKFELRKNDRGYKVGDMLDMEEYKAGEPTGRHIMANIIYMLEDYTGLEEGYCILGIEVESANE